MCSCEKQVQEVRGYDDASKLFLSWFLGVSALYDEQRRNCELQMVGTYLPCGNDKKSEDCRFVLVYGGCRMNGLAAVAVLSNVQR